MAKKVIDRRIQRTRRLLQDALLSLILEKGYDDVTVQDVIDRADVGRSTFYMHFQDKEDLFLSEFELMQHEFQQHLLGQSVTAESPWELTLLMFRHAQEHRQLYKALAGKQAGAMAVGHIQRYLTTLLREHLEPELAKKKNPLVPLDILAHYLVSSFMSLLTWWLDHDLPYPAERMNEIYRRLAQPGTDSVL